MSPVSTKAIEIVTYIGGVDFEGCDEILQDLGLFGLDELEGVIEEGEVRKHAVELRVQIQQHHLPEVAMVKVRQNVEYQPKDLPYDRLEGTRKFIS